MNLFVFRQLIKIQSSATSLNYAAAIPFRSISSTHNCLTSATSYRNKTANYKLMLKAKRRRQRRGKTGGPPRNSATFSTFIGFRKIVSFLPPKPGFTSEHLIDDPNLIIEIPQVPSSSGKQSDTNA